MKRFLLSLLSWRLWLKAGLTATLVAIVWPSVQSAMEPIMPSPATWLFVPVADLLVMLAWPAKRYRPLVYLGWGIILLASAVSANPVLGWPMTLVYQVARATLVATLMTVKD